MFVAFLVIGLIVAAIMGLATIMPAWLAALLVCAVFLLIALIGGLVGLRKFKKAMPLMPEETIRGLKHDLGIAKEGSDFDAAVLDPNSPQAKAAKAAKAEAEAKEKAEKEAKESRRADGLARRPPSPNSAAGWTSAASTSPGSATNSARSWTSSPRRRPCWPWPRHRLEDGKEQSGRQGRGRPKRSAASLGIGPLRRSLRYPAGAAGSPRGSRCSPSPPPPPPSSLLLRKLFKG